MKCCDHLLRLQVKLAGIDCILFEAEYPGLIARIDYCLMRKERGIDNSFFLLREIYRYQRILCDISIDITAARQEDVLIRVVKLFVSAGA